MGKEKWVHSWQKMQSVHRPYWGQKRAVAFAVSAKEIWNFYSQWWQKREWNCIESFQEALEAPKGDVTVVHAKAIWRILLLRHYLEDYNTLHQFILSEEHLLKNICHLELKHFKSREIISYSFKNTLEIRINDTTCGSLPGPIFENTWVEETKNVAKEFTMWRFMWSGLFLSDLYLFHPF